jgi:hypothetical protein
MTICESTNEEPMDAVTPEAAFFHLESGKLRFWVSQDDGSSIGATISKETLHYRFGGAVDGENALAIYEAHRTQIDEAVRKRRAAGSLEPIMLREFDVKAT